MSKQIYTDPALIALEEVEWLARLNAKLLKGVRPTHINGPVPEVVLFFVDGSIFNVSVREGVYFEGCLINTLRKAQPVESVSLTREGSLWILELKARTFPLLQLRAVDKKSDEIPFILDEGSVHA